MLRAFFFGKHSNSICYLILFFWMVNAVNTILVARTLVVFLPYTVFATKNAFGPRIRVCQWLLWLVTRVYSWYNCHSERFLVPNSGPEFGLVSGIQWFLHVRMLKTMRLCVIMVFVLGYIVAFTTCQWAAIVVTVCVLSIPWVLLLSIVFVLPKTSIPKKVYTLISRCLESRVSISDLLAG